MPAPQDLAVRAHLSQFALDYRNSTEVYANMLILPKIPFAKVQGSFYKNSKHKLRVVEGIKRGVNNDAATLDGSIQQIQFNNEERSLDAKLDIQERDAWEPGSLQPEREKISGITEVLMVNKEKELADFITNAANWPQGVVATPTKWDTASGDPIADIVAERGTVIRGALRKPNWLFLGNDVWDAITTNPNVVDRIKHVSATELMEDVFARLIGVDKVFPMMAVENTAKEGQPDVESFIWGEATYLMYSTPNPVNHPGTTFGFTSTFQDLQAGTHPKIDQRFDRFFAMWKYDQVVADFGTAQFFNDTLT